MKAFHIAISLICLGGVTSCTSGPNGNQAPSSRPQDPRLATVTVMRKSTIYGAAVKIDILLDAKKIASLWTGERVEFQVSPGTHFIAAPWRDLFVVQDQLERFDARAGEKYYFHYGPAGIKGLDLKQLSKEEGERELAKHRYRLITMQVQPGRR